MDLVLDLLRVLEVDRVHLEQSEVALAILRAADRPLYGVAGPQAETADLGGRDVDVVGAGQIVRFGRTQETEPVLKHFHRAGADDLDLLGSELLQDGEHELLLAHRGGVLNLDLLRESDQVRRGLGLQILKFDLAMRAQIGSDQSDLCRRINGKEGVVL